MKIEKVKKTVYNITFYPDAWKMSIKRFIASRKKQNLSTKEFEQCFCCGHKFKDDEIPIMIGIEQYGNRFACEKCLEMRCSNEKNITPCDYCNNNKSLYYDKSKRVNEVFIESDGSMTISIPYWTNEDDESINFKINYCPMCGRGVESEAE